MSVIELELILAEPTTAVEEALAGMRLRDDRDRWDISDETVERVLAWLRGKGAGHD